MYLDSDLHPVLAAVKGYRALLECYTVSLSGKSSAPGGAPCHVHPLPRQKAYPELAMAASRYLLVLQVWIGSGQVQAGPFHPDLAEEWIQSQIGGGFESLFEPD